MSTIPSEDSQTSSQPHSQLQDPSYTKYLPYLLSGELADITIFAPLPPGTHENPEPPPTTSKAISNSPNIEESTPHPANQYTPFNKSLNNPNNNEELHISQDSLFLTKNTLQTTSTTTTTTTTTTPAANKSLFMSKDTTSTISTKKDDSKLYMTFNLHRFIVAARSPVLAILLHQSPVLTISLRSDVFQALIWTMYTDSNDRIPIHLYPHVVWAAEYYAIKPAQIWSLQTTIRLVTKDNMIAVANHLLEAYSPINSTVGHSISPVKSSTTSNESHIDAITPILSLENCPKSFTYICDFILNILYSTKETSSELELHKLHPAIAKLLLQSDSTLSPLLFQ